MSVSDLERRENDGSIDADTLEQRGEWRDSSLKKWRFIRKSWARSGTEHRSLPREAVDWERGCSRNQTISANDMAACMNGTSFIAGLEVTVSHGGDVKVDLWRLFGWMVVG